MSPSILEACAQSSHVYENPTRVTPELTPASDGVTLCVAQIVCESVFSLVARDPCRELTC